MLESCLDINQLAIDVTYTLIKCPGDNKYSEFWIVSPREHSRLHQHACENGSLRQRSR